jgi:hypothetical protein
MEPEEIDKLFRDKLAGRPAVPSPDAWMRLQQKMEPPKKQRTMWVYYAAASVVVLLICGLLFFNKGGDEAGPAVATLPRVEPPMVAETPAKVPVESMPVARQQAEPVVAQAPVSTLKQKVSVRSHRPPGEVLAEQQPPAKGQDLIAASHPASSQSREAEAVAPSPQAPAQDAFARAAPDLSVVEVVVQRDADARAAQDPSLREQLNRKGQLLKNIYKQARNLKNGEPVELAAIGVDKSRIQEETKELKQKLTNVISL